MRQSTSTSFVTPHLASTGAEPVASGGDAAFGDNCRGVFTLPAGTYYYDLGGADAVLLHAMIQGDATIAITTATIEETDLAESEASVYSNVTGQWFATDITHITTSVEGTGWTNTNDVGGNAAGNAGGVAWNVTDCAARRYRLAVVVGTEGQARVNVWAKD